VMNAVNDALASGGASEIDMPATPLRVWGALRKTVALSRMAGDIRVHAPIKRRGADQPL
jgi:hypothetical protein